MITQFVREITSTIWYDESLSQELRREYRNHELPQLEMSELNSTQISPAPIIPRLNITRQQVRVLNDMMILAFASDLTLNLKNPIVLADMPDSLPRVD